MLAYLMYSYDTNDTKRRKRAITERTTMYNPACAGIFIEDWGVSEQHWDESLWGKLGFTYEHHSTQQGAGKNLGMSKFQAEPHSAAGAH